jgi:hypothetical protein
VDGAKQLSLEDRRNVISLGLEHNNLPIATSNNYFVTRNSLDRFDSKSTSINIECKNFAPNEETNEVTTCGTSVKEVFIVFAVGHTGVLTDHSSSVNSFGSASACLRIQMPHRHLFGACTSKLIVSSRPLLIIFGIATPGKAAGCLGEDTRDNLKVSNNVAIGSVPNKHFPIQGVSTTHKKAIVLTKGQKRYFVVVLRKSVNGSLFLEIPKNNIGILTALTTSE